MLFADGMFTRNVVMGLVVVLIALSVLSLAMLNQIRVQMARLQAANRELQDDVARRLQAEEALRMERRRLQEFLDAAGVLFVVADPQGRLLLANERAAAFVETPARHLVGASVFEVFWPAVAAAKKAFAGSGVVTFDRVGRGGRHITWTVVPLRDEDGRPAGVVASGQDVTESRALQAELIAHRIHLEDLVASRTEELQRSNRDLEQFAAAASHDLQAPVVAMAGFLELVRRTEADRLSSAGIKYIDLALDSTARMRRLIQSLLEFSKATGIMDVRPGVPSRALVQQVVADLANTADGGRVLFKVGDLPQVVADPVQIQRVFANLVGNAVKFGARTVRIECQDRGDAHEFLVTDDGPGVPVDKRETVFDIFRRLDGDKPGSGLGLAICKRVIERHGGRIWLADRPRGLQVCFTLPKQPVQFEPIQVRGVRPDLEKAKPA
jgi:PAS domain S-box-containing protein